MADAFAPIAPTTGDTATIFGFRWPYGGQCMALRTLSELSLCVREDGTWYVALPHVTLCRGGTATTPTQCGKDPSDALKQAWDAYGASDAIVLVDRPGAPRRTLRWNTFMWVDLDPRTGEGEQP